MMIEEILCQLSKESALKFGYIKNECDGALEILNNADTLKSTPAYVLREKCLQPFQLALESRVKRFTTLALKGIENILRDERFQSSLEMEEEETWLPIQILNTVYSTPNLAEEMQVDILKMLLNMTFATSWCMNSRVITKVIQVYIDTYSSSSQNIKSIIKAITTQMLNSFAEKIGNLKDVDSQSVYKIMGDHTKTLSFMQVDNDGDAEDMLADFKETDVSKVRDSLLEENVSILNFLTGKLESSSSSNQRQAVPLLLEGIYAILSKSPLCIRDHKGFQDLLWKQLCPILISLLSTPKCEKSAMVQKSVVSDEVGRGTGCSTTAPTLNSSSAKIIYNLSAELLRLVGCVGSLRPVLESLFHRMLLYPPPQHRHDVLRVVRELLASPEIIVNMVTPYSDGHVSPRKVPNADVSLLKIILDSVQECCHCNESSVCLMSVVCVHDFICSLEEICKGQSINGKVIERLDKILEENKGKEFESEETLSVQRMEDGSVEVEMSAERYAEMSAEIEELHKQKRLEEARKSLEADDVEPFSSEATEKSMDVKMCEKEGVDDQCNYLSGKHQAEKERANAREYISSLEKILSELLQLDSAQEVDEALQLFASNFCSTYANNFTERKEMNASFQSVILNADGVYLTTILGMSLNLKLHTCKYYTSDDDVPNSLTEEKFVDNILSSGLLLYISPTWLSEVYKLIICNDLLEGANYVSKMYSPFIEMLIDLDGMDSNDYGGQYLSSCKEAIEEPDENSLPLVTAGKTLAHRILSLCWDSVLDVLSVLLNGKSSCGITNSLALMLGTEGAKEESQKARETICLSLQGLQKAANLCCILGLQERCASIFHELANTACVSEEVRRSIFPEIKSALKSQVHPNKPKLVKLHAAHVLSLDVVMTMGIEMGSHSADCWKHVFRCCAYISELEHTYFSTGQNKSNINIPKIQHEHTQDLNLNSGLNIDGEEEVYNTHFLPAAPVTPQINIPELINQNCLESGLGSSMLGGGVLMAEKASKALCCLSQEVDQLFEDTANKLNLKALLNFLFELCEASKYQLKTLSKQTEEEDVLHANHYRPPANSLHLYRLQEVLMKIVNSSRPLLHLMRTWGIVSMYLIEAASHPDRNVSKMAVTCIHDYIITMLTNYRELAHFHVNEFLCKAFENLLCLELCDGDVQDQVVCCICELVEACAAEIQSGWRPLFGALRAVKVEVTADEEVNESRQRHISAVLDVFDVYLATDNVLVFANATVDCILCLLKYVRGPGSFDDDSDDSDACSDYFTFSEENESLCVPALQYLKQCCGILSSMWKMPSCPTFNGSHRIQMDLSSRFVDRVIPDMNLDHFSKHFNESIIHSKDKEPLSSMRHFEIEVDTTPDDKAAESMSTTSIDSGIEGVSSKSEKDLSLGSEFSWSPELLDNRSGVLHVWFLVLDGLATAISSCPKSFQPQTLEMLFELLHSAAKVPGPEYAMYCVNHLLLPMLQSWLRRGSQVYGYWITGASNFKQCNGLMADLVVDYVTQFAGKSECQKSLELILKQQLIVLTECCAQPHEVISRLGCSCIRHILLTAGPYLTESMWQIAADSLKRVLEVTSYSVRQLMLLFNEGSENFYGDKGQVKVATRKDCTVMECERLRQLAQQVFLLDCQLSEIDPIPYDLEEDKSYVFLLYPPNCEGSVNPDDIIARVPFRNIIIGLLSHQLALQTIGYLLLHGAVGTTFEQPMSPMFKTKDKDFSFSKLPGMLPHMSTRNVVNFLDSLRASYRLACDFDVRPGLKFLMQKVARTEVAANLYKQAGASMVFYIHTLVEICSKSEKLSLDSVLSTLKEFNMSFSGEEKGEISWTESELMKSGKNSLKTIPENINLFLCLLQKVGDELCQTYVNLLSDKEGTGSADRMGEQPLFFLIAQPDELTDLVNIKRRVKSPDEQSDMHPTMTEIVPVEGQIVDQDISDEDDVPTKENIKSPPSSPLKSPLEIRSKREARYDHEGKVYTLANDSFIKNLMTQYKRRKQHHSMPSFIKMSKQKKELQNKKKSESFDADIEKQQKSSIMKDSEAHVKSWSELISTILQLLQQLPEERFKTMLPAAFNCVNQLVCHAEDPRIKDCLAQWLHRVGSLYGFKPE